MKKMIILIICFIFILTIGYNIYSKKNLSVFKEEKQKNIALTFDDGPKKSTTNRLLDELKKRNIKANFFVLGMYAEENPDIILRMINEGHLIGNHTYDHKSLYKIKDDEIKEEVNKTNEIIYNITGRIPEYFRPSYGNINEKIRKLIPLKVVKWTVDSKDWAFQNVDRIYNHVINKIKENDIILMHDIYDTSVDAALKIIDKLEKENYKFVTIDKLI